MLILKPQCEYCRGELPPQSGKARICSFEHTFCQTCAEHVFKHQCPNCTGPLEKRPARPEHLLEDHPAGDE